MTYAYGADGPFTLIDLRDHFLSHELDYLKFGLVWQAPNIAWVGLISIVYILGVGR